MKKKMATVISVLISSAMLLAVPCAADEAAADVAEKHFSFSTGVISDKDPIAKGMLKFAELLDSYSGGKMTADCFNSGALGDNGTQTQSCQFGSIDVISFGTSYAAGIVPEIQVLELPYVFEKSTDYYEKMDGELGEALASKFEGTGLKLLGWWEIGFRHVCTSKKPVNSIEDLQGMKFRALTAPYQVATWEAYGTSVTPIDGGELFSSMQTGVVDGMENSLVAIYADKYYEVAKYVSLTGHVFSPSPVFVSENTWNSMDAAQQEVFMKAFTDATAYHHEVVTNSADEALEGLKEAGAEVNETPDLTGFKEASEAVYDKWRGEFGDELLDLLQK